MIDMIEIYSIDDKRINVFKSLRGKALELLENRLFIAEGEKVFVKLLASKLEIVSIFATENYYNKYQNDIAEKNICESNKFVAVKSIMEQIVGFRLHSGVMALARQPDDTQLYALGDQIVVLNCVIDAENVGSIVRNAVAFGFNSIIYDTQSSSPYLRRAVRVSMGNVFNMKIHKCSNLLDTLKYLKIQGYEIVSSEIYNNALPILNYNVSHKVAIIFGSEGYGVAKEILDISDKIVYIPIKEQVTSLNVASSSAIILFHLGNKLFQKK